MNRRTDGRVFFLSSAPTGENRNEQEYKLIKKTCHVYNTETYFYRRDISVVDKYIAHSENTFHKTHSLSRHLRETAAIASSFAGKEEYKLTFYLAELWHDLGKQ
jgi:hypothetical protein